MEDIREMSNTVSVFKPYPFTKGQKIRIEGSKRSGDWEVIDFTENKVTLRCPVSKKEFEWALFCYHVDDEENAEWPRNN